MDTSNAETNIAFAPVVDAVKVYSQQTGSFTVTSSRGVNYVFILYSYKANAILVEVTPRIVDKFQRLKAV